MICWKILFHCNIISQVILLLYLPVPFYPDYASLNSSFSLSVKHQNLVSIEGSQLKRCVRDVYLDWISDWDRVCSFEEGREEEEYCSFCWGNDINLNALQVSNKIEVLRGRDSGNRLFSSGSPHIIYVSVLVNDSVKIGICDLSPWHLLEISNPISNDHNSSHERYSASRKSNDWKLESWSETGISLLLCRQRSLVVQP